MAGVAFDKVTKRFADGSEALKQLDLSIRDGEFMVLVGPSGCGKSTALRLLAGLESVTDGEIRIDGQVVNDVSTQQRNVAMVFQNYALYPHMSVYDNLAFPLKMARTPGRQIREKVDDISRVLNLGDLLERRPGQLSGGQRQRVAMGRALVRDPSVFLLDEPLSNLDARLRAQIRADIAKIQQRLSKTTIYVTHDQVEAMTLGDRVAVLHDGVIQQVGTPEELYREPANCFVARFIGSPGMNILPSTLVEQGGELAVRIGESAIRLAAAGDEARRLAQHNGRRLRVGIRPEALRADGGEGGAVLDVEVKLAEYLGHEVLLYFVLPGSEAGSDGDMCIARIPGSMEENAHGRTRLYVDADALYLFDEAGRRIRSGAKRDPQQGGS